MAECNLATLLTSACDNDFMGVAQNENLSRGIILQLLYNIADGGETEEELYAQACSNGFQNAAQNEGQFREIVLQLLCNVSA